MPGFSFRCGLGTFTRTLTVLVSSSNTGSMNAVLPLNVSPGYASLVKVTSCP